ncbi:MAG: rhodanese-like domain-containing protein [Pseudomonadota bacterium]
MRLFILALLLVPVQSPAYAEKPMAPEHIPGATLVHAEEVVPLLLEQNGIVLIDSRKEDEYAKGHIEGAVNLPDTTMTPEVLATHVPGRDTPILFYCNGERCLRSSNAVTMAQQWGYRNLFWFRGGWVEWRRKRLPVAK